MAKPPPTSPPIAAKITRSEVIAIADAYVLHAWTPTARNIFHGVDPDGVPVDTPDSRFHPPDARAGWWEPDRQNIGVPYMWGGFSSLAEFDAGIQSGAYAGDIYTAFKRQQLDAAVSRHAVGIDCSGLISRCWKLPRSHSTRELARLCDRLSSPAGLQPGDIMNLNNGHVVLFKEWVAPDKIRLRAYEAGSPFSWKAVLDEMPLKLLTDQGYEPLRYKNISE